MVVGCQSPGGTGDHSGTYIDPTTFAVATPQHPCLSSSNIGASSELAGNSSCLQTGIFDPSQSEETSPEMVSFCNSVDQEVEDIGDLQSLAREYVSRYFPGVRFRPPTSQ
ncbi:UNVERIFIED_CONTAM: hypothetical protein Sradi_1121300 [Sesamum radiatum]|uniref:Uncharacterized protein n=1 Tax=Sesamum radiatum TaxID=300843 RepID=A0AAW2VC86_SESRA